MTVPTDTSLSASMQPDDYAHTWARLRLERRVRPGLVDIAHVRSLSSRKVGVLADTAVLRRLLARRGADDRLIASGTLVLAQTPLAQAAAAGVAAASQESVGAGVEQPAPLAHWVVCARGIVVDRSIEAPAGPGALTELTAPRVASGVPVGLIAGEALARAAMAQTPADAPQASDAATRVDDLIPAPKLEVISAADLAMPRARDLPGPAIGADLLLPPNPLPVNPRRAARIQQCETRRVEIDGEPVDGEMLPMVQIAVPKLGTLAEDRPGLSFTASPSASAAMPASRPQSARAANATAATPAPIDTPPLGGPAEVMALLSNRPESRQLAESVGRELVRSLRRAHERKGIPSWKS